MRSTTPRTRAGLARTAGGLLVTGAVAASLLASPSAAWAAAETRTWVGPDNGLWSVAENWSPAGAPQDGDSVVVDDFTVNDLGPIGLASIELRGGVIDGDFPLSAEQISTPTDSGESFLFSPVLLTATTTFTVGLGSTLAAQEPLSGPGDLVKQGASRLLLRAAGSYTGSTLVAGGAIDVEHPDAIDATSQVVVTSGAWLSVGNTTIDVPITLAGGGFGGLGALLAPDGATFAGPVALTGNTVVGVAAGALEFTGALTGTGFQLTKRGAGTLTIVDESTAFGLLRIEQGAFDLAGRSLDAPLALAEEASLVGSGTLAALLASPGDVELGTAGLDIASSTTLGSDLELTLAGPTAGVGYGTLRVGGDLAFQNTAVVLPTMAPGYDAPLGTVFRVIETTGTISGSFLTLPEGAVVPGVPSEALRVGYLDDAVTLTVIERSLTDIQVAPSDPEVGETVTLTARVSSRDASTAPTGTVTFRNGAVALGTATLVEGIASITTSFAAAGTVGLSADYSGSASVAPSTSPTAFTPVGIPRPSISGPGTAQGYTGEPFEYRPTVVGDMGGAIFALGGLPSWLTLDPATGVLTGTPTAPGEWVVRLKPSGFIPAHTVTITVSDVALESLELTPSTSTAAVGDTITLEVVGIDSLGREVPLPTEEFVVTSSVATDVIDGLEVTFPTASPHVLSVLHVPSGLVGSVTIEVSPAAEPEVPAGSGGLAATGTSLDAALVAALLLIVGAALLRRRVRT